jgi:hypothetical protein
MTENEIKRRNERLTPICIALARHDQCLSRAEYEECCSLAGIEPHADEEIRRAEYRLTRDPYKYSDDPMGDVEIRRRVDRARLSAINLAE